MAIPRQYYRYLLSYPESQGWGARVLSAGCTRIPEGQEYPAQGHPDGHHFTWESGRTLSTYTFVYITAGEGVFETKVSGELQVSAGDVFILFPGVWHRYRPTIDVGWNEYWVECDGDLLDRAMHLGGLNPAQPVLGIGHDTALLDCFISILETIQAAMPGYQAIIGLQSATIVARICSLLQIARETGTPTEEKIVRQAIVAMSEGIGGRMDWTDLAARLGISYSSFRRIFPKATGRSPGDFFIEMKMNRAKQLLGIPDRSIQEISVLLGFDSPSHFSHSFKSRIGISPRHYRSEADP